MLQVTAHCHIERFIRVGVVIVYDDVKYDILLFEICSVVCTL